MTTTIAIDAMGGDYGADVTVPAAIDFLKKTHNANDYKIILVGIEDQIRPLVSQNNADDLIANQSLLIYPATQVVDMEEAPAMALKKKKDSSMRVAINLVKENTAQACVSAGNTGALMATARFVLKMIPGIDRPALCSIIPSKDHQKTIRMLDLGANVDSSPDMLLQFAIMGSVLTRHVDNVDLPKIGLLNVGAEDIKGSEKVKKAASLLSQSSLLNYTGYVEGHELYDNKVDVVVCDGFEGNISLKTSEGVADLLVNAAREEFKRNIFTRFAALVAMPVLKAIKMRLDPRSFNGATFIGLNGIVIKSHGGADKVSFMYALETAAKQAKLNMTDHIREQITIALDTKKTG